MILADPDDAAGYRVYGDWLASHGHPRGELVALHDRGLEQEAAALLAEKDHELWGELVDDTDLLTQLRWRLGFVERVRIAHDRDRYEREPEPLVPLVLGRLLDGPGRFLRELVVGIVDFERNSYDSVVSVLAKRGPLPTIRSLEFGDFYYEETELNWSAIGDLGPLWPAVPRLERLWLRSGSMQLGEISAPELRQLTIITGGLDADSARAIATATFPKIESLDLMFGTRGKNTLKSGEAIAPLLQRTDLPALRSLGIKNFAFHLELVEALVASPLVPQLRELDLSLGTLGDAEAEHLAAAAPRFAHLERLDVSANYLTPRGLHALARIGCPIISSDVDGPFRSVDTNTFGQRDSGADPDDPDDEGERYAPVYE